MQHKILRALVTAGFFVAGLWIPQYWCKREAPGWYHGDPAKQLELAHGVEQWIRAGVNRKDFETGSDLFNNEWVFGTYMMAGMGFAQLANQHPELRPDLLPLVRLCANRLLDDKARGFDRSEWNEDPLDSLAGESGHAAYLGYLNLLLSAERLLDSSSPHAALNDRITETLARRMRNAPSMLLETYPGEIYPVDNCAVIGSISLYDRAGGKSHEQLLNDWRKAFRTVYIDRASGLLYQSNKSIARGSGTALAAYFLSFGNVSLSKELYRAARSRLLRTPIGFGMVKEFDTSNRSEGDIDSGPLVFGYGPSATAFLLSGARIHRDEQAFNSLYASAYLLGAPYTHSGRLHFLTGGALGDAILFAMLTAGDDRQ